MAGGTMLRRRAAQIECRIPQTVGCRAAAARRIERRRVIAFAASFAAIVAVGFIAGFANRFTPSPAPGDFSERLLDEIADYHVLYAREDEHLVEVPADRREHIEAWLGDRLEREIRV